MFKHLSIRMIFSIGMLFTFFGDGSFSYNLSSFLFKSYSVVPCTSILWLVLTLFFVGNDLHLIMWATVIGGLFDWYYTGILGVFLFIFPLVIYISKFLCTFLSDDFWNGFLVYFIDVLVLLGLEIVANHFANDAVGEVGIKSLLLSSLLTLLFNLIIFSALYLPVRLLYNRCREK